MAQIFSSVVGWLSGFLRSPKSSHWLLKDPRPPGLPPQPYFGRSRREFSKRPKISLSSSTTMGGGHFPQTGWAWCHIGGLCPWAAVPIRGGGSSHSQNKAAFSWPGREWLKSRSGECSQLNRKNWFRMASRANGEEPGCSAQVSFPKPVALRQWPIPPKGKDPNSTIGRRTAQRF